MIRQDCQPASRHAKALPADKVRHILDQIDTWAGSCQRQADRYRRLYQEAENICRALDENWLGEESIDCQRMLEELRRIWGTATQEMEQKRDAYDEVLDLMVTIIQAPAADA